MMPQVEDWMNSARTDLGVARHLNETYHPKPVEIICYHSQQAAEKAIKALIIYKGAAGGMPKVHDLSFLLDQIKNMVSINEKFYDYADTLTPYGVSVKYPHELFLTENHACQAISCAEEIVLWAETEIRANITKD